ncbi:MAG TPA: hypothetical protein VE967_10815 [Gemmatimonadaceae bacterium]|nr:hypothetical protein [Gemmatimonadaceae bacterium]
MFGRKLGVAGLALAAFATAAAAQTKARHTGWSFGLGVADGKLRVSCSGCEFPAKEGGLEGVFQVGWSLSDAIIILADGQVYAKHQEDSRGNPANTDYQMGSVVAQWYPSRKWEHFLKAGFGMSHTAMFLDVSSLGLRDVRSNNGVMRMGLGTDLRFGRNWSLTPFLDYSLGMSANTNVAGIKAKVSMLSFGVAATWH